MDAVADIAEPAAQAVAAGGLVGSWKIRSFVLENVTTGARRAVFGDSPRGYLVFTPEGRVISVLTPGDRPLPETAEQRLEAFGSMLAYAGRYRVEGDRFIADVDVAWDESYVGTQQVRQFRIDGDRLSIETAPQLTLGGDPSPSRAIVVWQRER